MARLFSLFRSLSVIGLLLPFLSLAAYAADPIGLWLTSDGEAKIRITRCEKGICGTIVWLKEPNDTDGKPKTDRENVDQELKKRPMLGLEIFHNLQQLAPNKYQGSLYNPDDGRTYDGQLELGLDGLIKMKGCVFGGIICDDDVWSPTK
jgi:uncharacterized protein (DUF2147 family)